MEKSTALEKSTPQSEVALPKKVSKDKTAAEPHINLTNEND